MLNIEVNRSAEGVERYFDRELAVSDYLMKEPGVWGGRGAERPSWRGRANTVCHIVAKLFSERNELIDTLSEERESTPEEERRIAQQERDSKTTKLFHGKAEIEHWRQQMGSERWDSITPEVAKAGPQLELPIDPREIAVEAYFSKHSVARDRVLTAEILMQLPGVKASPSFLRRTPALRTHAKPDSRRERFKDSNSGRNARTCL
jgi:hypothetical protein